MATLADLFAGRNLTAMVHGIKPGLPVRVPPQLLVPTDRVPGHVFEWDEVDGNRDMALIVAQNSPANRVGMQGAKKKSATMLRSFESQAHTMNAMRNIVRDDGTTRDELGRNFIKKQSLWFKQRLTNLVQTCVQSMLFRFSLHFNEKGQLLTNSSGATVSVEPSIAAGQLTQLDIMGGGSIIGASWGTAGTDILGHVNEIIRQMFQLGGWQITEAFHGKNIPGYIATNTVAKEYINRTPALAQQQILNASKVPDGFQNLNWHDASNAFYLDASGSVQTMLGDDEIVFTPSPADPTWWKYAHGSEMVPTGIVPKGTDVESLLSNVTEVMGEFSYAEMVTNPLAIEQFVGMNFLPVISALKAVCKADVTP